MALDTRLTLLLLTIGCSVPAVTTNAGQVVPLRQSKLDDKNAGPPRPLTLRDAARDDRWMGVSPRDVRWALDGSGVYFRWNENPLPEDDAALDPWFWVGREAETVKQVPWDETTTIPAANVSWSRDGRRAAWALEGNLYIYDVASREKIRNVVASVKHCRSPRMSQDGESVSFMMEEDLYLYDMGRGTVQQMTWKCVRPTGKKTEAGEWLESQQIDLFDFHRRRLKRKEASEDLDRRRRPVQPQAIPVADDSQLENVRLSPDHRFVTFRTRKENKNRPTTDYIDFASESGYAAVAAARSKVGEPQDEFKFGIVPYDPSADPEKIEIQWVTLADRGDRGAIVYGPYWNLDGSRAVLQFVSQDHKDLWIAELDLEKAQTKVIVHDRDDAWLGGPSIQANYFQPPLLEWLTGNRFVFASERSGWSHLHLVDSDGNIRAITSGEWEVRDAALARDRTFWLLRASREHPCDDHLYVLPAAGGAMERLTTVPGRHEGFLSPDGTRLAVLSSDSVHLPDLYLRGSEGMDAGVRISVSGTNAYYQHPLVEPETVSFSHTDGRLLWAALFKPHTPNGAAILHIHGGGYRQFSHRGWTVYGYSLHLGAINYLVQQGYTVLDFDYRGSAGFGRDYRTDIYRSMGMKDIDGMVTATKYLHEKHGIDEERVGVYGISYGGFATLMALFRYPGIFAGGVANAAVTDWAHYSHGWTSRILNVPHNDEEAYRRSSPIYHADGLADPLLIVHGLIDDNVHFQDAARLVQKLIELEKDFEVMYYPVERHVIETEASRYDYVKRLTTFFEEHLLER